MEHKDIRQAWRDWFAFQVLTFKWWLSRSWEKFIMWCAWKLPRSVAYWAAVRVMTHATCNVHTNRTPVQLNCVQVLKAWRHEA